jgi:hypothetical protein
MGSLRLSGEFQRILAAMMSNSTDARLWLDQPEKLRVGFPGLTPADLAALDLMREQAPRVLMSAAILTRRRYSRVKRVLPLTVAILRDGFGEHWNEYLRSRSRLGALPGLAEATAFSDWLLKRLPPATLESDVARLEQSQWRIAKASAASGERKDRFVDGVLCESVRLRLSALVEIQSFSWPVDVVAEEFRRSQTIVQTCSPERMWLLVRPASRPGGGPSVTRLPSSLAELLRALTDAMELADLVQAIEPARRDSVVAGIRQFLVAGVLEVA